MRAVLARYRIPPGLGMTSLVLGHIALIVVFMPVLGVPLSALGLLFGALGVVLSLFWPGTNLRWSLAGVAVCCIALSANLAIHLAPEGYLGERNVPPSWRPPPGRPYVPPPARP